ncbi:hypothetical protein FB107DRAFT_224282 [Schizophyllum commune]
MSSEDILDPKCLPLATTNDEVRVAQLMDASQAMDPSDDAPTSNPPSSQPPALCSQGGDQDRSASDTKYPAPAPEVTPDVDSGSSSKGEQHNTSPADLCAAVQSLQVSCKESEAPEAGPPAPAPSSGGEGAPGNDAGATAHVGDALLHPSEGPAASVLGYTPPSQTPLAQNNQALASFALHPPPSPPRPSLPALYHQQDQGPGWPISHFFSQMMPLAENGSPNPPSDVYDSMQAPPARYSRWRMRMATFPADGMSHAPRDMVSDVAPGRSGGSDLTCGRADTGITDSVHQA